MDQSEDGDNSKRKQCWETIKPTVCVKQVEQFLEWVIIGTKLWGQIHWASASADVWRISYQKKSVLVGGVTDILVVVNAYHISWTTAF